MTNSSKLIDEDFLAPEKNVRLIDPFASTRRLRERFLSDAGKRYEEFLSDPKQPPHAVVCIRLNNCRELRGRFGFRLLEDLEDQIEARALDKLKAHDFFLKVSDSSLIGILAPEADGCDADQWAKAMLARLTDPAYRLESSLITPTFSIGLCWFDLRVRDVEEALLDAMQVAENLSASDSNQFQIFVPDTAPEKALRGEEDISGKIRRSLRTNRIRMVFQPLLTASGEASRYFQTWPRLISNSGQLIGARYFLTVARRQNLLGPLQLWAIKRSLQYLIKNENNTSHIRLFVNVSPEAFSDSTFTGLTKVFNKFPDVAPRIIAEFEAFHIEYSGSDTRRIIERLRSMGVVLGVSGVSKKHLKSQIFNDLPIKFLRLSSDFSHGIDRDNEGYDEFIDFIKRSHSAQRKIIVPEVSEAKQVINFWQSGVDLIQGEYIDQPSTVIEIEK